MTIEPGTVASVSRTGSGDGGESTNADHIQLPRANLSHSGSGDCPTGHTACPAGTTATTENSNSGARKFAPCRVRTLASTCACSGLGQRTTREGMLRACLVGCVGADAGIRRGSIWAISHNILAPTPHNNRPTIFDRQEGPRRLVCGYGIGADKGRVPLRSGTRSCRWCKPCRRLLQGTAL